MLSLESDRENRRVGRAEIERVVQRLPAHAVARCREINRQLMKPAIASAWPTAIVAMLRDAQVSSAEKLVILFVYRIARYLRNGGLDDHAFAHRDLAWLDAVLLAREIELASCSENAGESAAGEQTAQAVVPVDVEREGVALAYRLCLSRTPSSDEIDIWKTNFGHGLSFAEFLGLLYRSPEAERLRQAAILLPHIDDGKFVQYAYELIMGRGCTPWEIDHWQKRFASGSITRGDAMAALFTDKARTLAEDGDAVPAHDALSCHVMGTGQTVTLDQWRDKARKLEAAEEPESLAATHSRFRIRQAPTPLVTAIASLYRGAEFIEQFMENITTQSCFRDYCELVIIDADSPENESEVIERYCRQHGNIVYKRMNHRIGIYDAWNVGAKLASGEYLTNTNLDDLRRNDSLELQAATLDNLPFVDVVYQDFYYSFDPRLSFEEVTRFGYRSDLPEVTRYNMMNFNSPHNAPMWRKRLHAELGYFDTSYRSAGDYEFWMRCLVAGKVFYKLNDAHVVYYQNPDGISTRPDTRGVEEARRILKTYGRKLVSNNITIPDEQFVGSVLGGQTQPGPINRYTATQLALRAFSIRSRATGMPVAGSRR
jgi:Glycosyl transferase family 2